MGALAGRIGLDLGSVAVHAVVATAEGEILHGRSVPSAGRPLEVLRTLIEEIAEAWGPLSVPVGVTGSARDLFRSHVPEASPVNEVVASARGTALLSPDARGVIEVGGHTSRWMALRDDGTGDLVDFSISDLCAAGAGVFLEQQAGRLRLSVEELGAQAAQPESGATVAGRCTVFAKSDMIHLQQKGTPVPEIAYGLCLALVRNFQASVLRGRGLRKPIALVGGGAANPGLVRAFAEVLGLEQDELTIPDHADLAGALGAAMLGGREGRAITPEELLDALDSGARCRDGAVRFTALPEPGCAKPLPEPGGDEARGPLLLGVDVGSVSTNLALVTPEGKLVDAIYLATRGRPLDVLGEGLAELHERHADRLQITGVATTGSGRHLAGEFLGADLVRNEITAQLRGAAGFMERVDTVLEIGGQDSKYIAASGGHIVDFTMNKVCAAGTGSFLEEQAERLGLSIIDEFADRALAGPAPVDLGSRCTVFMDNELVQAMRDGVGTEDLAAGLALSVARNYLEKVVGPRPIGEHVLFQGGTASNRAVVAAFRQLLGRPVMVHPYNRVSGAIGAAMLLQDAREAGELESGTRFRGLDACNGVVERSFECAQCSNRCQVTRFSSDGRTHFFGDTCERYSERDGSRTGQSNPNHPLARRWRMLLEEAGLEDGGSAGRCADVVGIPRASVAFQFLPIWTALVRASGREPLLSPPSSSRLLASGQQKLRADACLPIKIAYGHVQALVDKGVREVLLPSVHAVDRRQADEKGPYVCAFTRHLPWMLKSAFDCRLIAPELEIDLGEGREVLDVDGLAGDLGIGPDAVRRAVADGRAALHRWNERLLELGREILAGAGDRVLVVMGKPYNLADSFLNMDLGRQLDRLGLPAIPMDCLPLDEVELDGRYDDLVWAGNRDYVRASLMVRKDPRLFPVVLSSFGCGPDGFGVKHLEELLADRPRLFLELDEHRAEAGFVTRLEAFADEIDAHLRRERIEPVPIGPRPNVGFGTSGRLFLPYFSDHAQVHAGVMRSAGFEVELLPKPDEQVRLAGERFSSGRECHPFTLLAGDVVSLIESKRQRPGDALLFPGGVNACLFSQYTDGLRYVLRRLGDPDLVIAAPLVPEIQEKVGLRGGITLYQGMMATEILLRRSCSHRPYEVEPGSVDRVYQELLLELGEAARRYEVLDFLPDAVDRLDRVPRTGGPRRPLVGVAGDIYTRVNDFANGALFGRLEQLGCEVWPAPYSIDIFDFNQPRFAKDALRRGAFRRVLNQTFIVAVKQMQAWWLNHRWPEDERLREPTPKEVLANAAPYLGPESASLVLLNVSKMVDFARRGADGILNAICFGCMVGGISAALADKVRADHDDIPMATLAYGGTAGTGGDARLEAFVEQVKRHRQRKVDGRLAFGGPGRSESPLL
jgi:predicted CoA-substrate-specific enzyme activase